MQVKCYYCTRELYCGHDVGCPYWFPEHIDLVDFPESTCYPSETNPFHHDHELAESAKQE